jgi:putative DNA primase/helicase
MTAPEIARSLGGGCRSGRWWRCRCPVHGSRGPTLALRDGEHGIIPYCHAGCSQADILAELQRRGLVGRTATNPPARGPSRAHARDPDNGRVAAAHRIWDAAQAGGTTPLKAYLAGRGIGTAPPSVLRYAPTLRRPDGSEQPAVVARVDDVNGRLIGVHRTWIAQDQFGRWHRLDRASLGPIRGGGVRLASPAETLMVGEGIETCLAAMQATKKPAWAALSTSGMVGLILPSFVRSVIVLADHDRSGAGERAAYAAAARWVAEGRTVRVAVPPERGTDFNDVLLRGEVRDAAA